MIRFCLNAAVFLAGLAVVCWIGAGYLGSNLLALAVTLLIGVGYLTGAIELQCYRRASSALTRAIAGLSAPSPQLESWLEQLPFSLRSAVRLRLDGQRVALPQPVLTPYLVGLLVLLGMLGTLLGMVVTLRGASAALQNATDLDTIRASLATPVNGLGFAFGTSIAGVATSAMLGLLSALCRRERIEATQRFDTKIATALREHSYAYQRDETFRLLQRQAAVMPTLVDRLDALMTRIERQSQTLSERQLAGQQAFLDKVEHAHERLASSMAHSLKECAAESARAVGATLQPAVQATMAGLARETASLHDTVTDAVRQQLHALTRGFDATTHNMAALWEKALADHRRSNSTLTEHMRASVDRMADITEQRACHLLQAISMRLETNAADLSKASQHALLRHEQACEKLAANNRHALEAATETFAQRSASWLDAMDQSHARLQTELASQHEQRLATWTETLTSMATALRDRWDETSTQATLHANDTIAEIGRLVQVASQAPRAAAEVIAEVRQQLCDSMARDTAMLEERNRLLQTLATLLDAVNHASAEQRSAIDALVATSADLLDRAGSRFTDRVDAQTRKMDAVAAQLTSSAVEVASLGEAFGEAVQSFGASNDALIAHLQRVEAALNRSVARSDEQLAYYVAQAREVIDLSMMSQKQIVEELQQLADRRAGAKAP